MEPVVIARKRSISFAISVVFVLLAVVGLFLFDSPPHVDSAGAWMPTGSMANPRAGQTATLLPSGKVLVVGGANGPTLSVALATAELYDPATGTWSPTGTMSTARMNHTATLLSNGKVLVAGGFDGSSYLASAELYDPATGSWSLTGAMNIPRRNHVASDGPWAGKVLVAGGDASPGSQYLNLAELYDPATGTWSWTGNMNPGRDDHVAVRLLTEQVLVVGGNSAGGPLTSALRYDSGWSATGSMATARRIPMAALLPNGKVLVAGGYNVGGDLATSELYDPAPGSWSPTGSMSAARQRGTATLLPDGKVLAAGGYNSGSGHLATAELYDPVSGSWGSTGSMTGASSEHTATLLQNGKVLVAGGNSAGGALASAELYTPPVPGGPITWIATGTMSAGRWGHTATLLPNGKVLVAGGSDAGNPYLATAELYDPSSGMWSATGSMNSARYSPTATLLPNGKVLVAGGRNGSPMASAELYDPTTGSWAFTGSMLRARSDHTATLLPNGKVLVVGGWSSGTLESSAELYDPSIGIWIPAATSLSGYGRTGHTATLLPGGKVLVAGGFDGQNTYVKPAELYDPAADSWSWTGSMITGRTSFTATLLPNGKVLVAGGNSAYACRCWLASAELYDPVTGSWTTTGSMSWARGSHTATVLPDGKVLVAGGGGIWTWSVLFSGSLTAAEVYDPGSGVWSATGSMSTPRGAHSATRLSSGKALVAGGGSSAATAELYMVPGSAVGGIAELPDVTGARLNAGGSSSPNARVLTAVIAGAVVAGAVALSGAAWYARRRWLH